MEDDFHQAGFAAVEALEPCGAFAERSDGGDERIDFDGAGLHEGDALGVFAGRGAGAEEAKLAGDDGLQRDFDARGEVADERDCASAADGLDGCLDGGLRADGFDGDVRALAFYCFAKLRDDVGTAEEGSVCAERLRECETAFVDIDGEDAGAAEVAEGLEGEKADHACAEDDSGAAGFDGGDARRVDGDGDCFDQCGVGVRKAFGELVDNVRGHGDVFGECAVAAIVAAGDAEDLTVVAEIDEAAFAIGALTAGDGGVEGDAVADGEINDRGAEAGDDARCFMTHDERRDAAAGAAIVAVDVAAADAAGADLNEDFAWSDCGLGQVAEVKRAVVFENECLHGFTINRAMRACRGSTGHRR